MGIIGVGKFSLGYDFLIFVNFPPDKFIVRIRGGRIGLIQFFRDLRGILVPVGDASSLRLNDVIIGYRVDYPEESLIGLRSIVMGRCGLKTIG